MWPGLKAVWENDDETLDLVDEKSCEVRLCGQDWNCGGEVMVNLDPDVVGEEVLRAHLCG